MATVCEDGVPIVYAIGRDSFEVPIPILYGYPDLGTWARHFAGRIPKLSICAQLDFLLKDNAEHLDALERAVPGAGEGLRQRVRYRIHELEDQNDDAAEPFR